VYWLGLLAFESNANKLRLGKTITNQINFLMFKFVSGRNAQFNLYLDLAHELLRGFIIDSNFGVYVVDARTDQRAESPASMVVFWTYADT
jgi:hypothetical protein